MSSPSGVQGHSPWKHWLFKRLKWLKLFILTTKNCLRSSLRKLRARFWTDWGHKKMITVAGEHNFDISRQTVLKVKFKNSTQIEFFWPNTRPWCIWINKLDKTLFQFDNVWCFTAISTTELKIFHGSSRLQLQILYVSRISKFSRSVGYPRVLFLI